MRQRASENGFTPHHGAGERQVLFGMGASIEREQAATPGVGAGRSVAGGHAMEASRRLVHEDDAALRVSNDDAFRELREDRLAHGGDAFGFRLGEGEGTLGGAPLHDFGLSGVEKDRIVERDRGLAGDAFRQTFLALTEPPGLRMPEKQRAEHLAGARADSDGEIGAHGKMALRHAAMGAVARVRLDVVGAHDARPVEGGLEDAGGAGQPEAREGLQRSTRERIEPPDFGTLAMSLLQGRHAFEEGAIGCTGEGRCGIDDALHELVAVELGGEIAPDGVQRLEATSLLLQRPGGPGKLRSHAIDLGDAEAVVGRRLAAADRAGPALQREHGAGDPPPEPDGEHRREREKRCRKAAEQPERAPERLVEQRPRRTDGHGPAETGIAAEGRHDRDSVEVGAAIDALGTVERIEEAGGPCRPTYLS